MTKEQDVAATNLIPTIEVACPHCATCWALPRARIGPGGARVQCARCEGSFEWRLARGARLPDARANDDETVAPVERWSPSDLDTWLDDDVPAPRAAQAAVDAVSPHANAVAELDPSDVTPDLVARLAVEELVSARAGELLDAYDRGALFAEFGPALTESWLQCRARLGPESDPIVFRAALMARLGIDLPQWVNRG